MSSGTGPPKSRRPRLASPRSPPLGSGWLLPSEPRRLVPRARPHFRAPSLPQQPPPAARAGFRTQALERTGLLKYTGARVEGEGGSIRREQRKNLSVSSHDVHGPGTSGGQNLSTHDV